MKLTVTVDRLVQLEGVYLPIVLLTDKGERFIISMRDGGFEFRYNGKPYRAVNGLLSEVIPDQPEQSNEVDNTPYTNAARESSLLEAAHKAANATLTDQDLIDNPHFKDAGFKQGDSVIISEGDGRIEATGVN